MGLFKSEAEKRLDAMIHSIEMNCSNNYKDAAQEDLDALEHAFATMLEKGLLKEKAKAHYERQVGIYKEKLKGYTHKDQKPFWT